VGRGGVVVIGATLFAQADALGVDGLKPWGKDQVMGLLLMVVLFAMCIPSTRRMGIKVFVVGFVALVALETIAPGTVTQ
jgi:hypothetical protein